MHTNDQPQTDDQPQTAAIERAIDGYRQLVQMLSATHPPEFPEPGVTMAQMRALMLLSVVGEARMSDLAHRLGISLSTLSSLADRLVEAQLIERRVDANDRRSVLISLAPQGVATLEMFQELGIDHLRQLLAHLSPDQTDTVIQAIDHLVAAARRLSSEVSR